jgi:transcriptional regulator
VYLPKHFEETRVEVLHGLIRAYPLGALVSVNAGGLDATHIPFEVDADVARANPVWRETAPGAPALVIFQGPDTYVSPSWYPTKSETGKVVPTWNYAVVHAHGAPRFIDDRGWLRAFVERLTERHEAERPAPWKVTDAPADFIDKQVGAIIGLEIPIARLIGKWKVSQNRSPQDRAGVADGLLREVRPSSAAMADLVRRSGSE